MIASFNSWDAPGKDEHDVLPEVGQLSGLTTAKTFSKPDQQKQRTHAPRDAEHGEEGA